MEGGSWEACFCVDPGSWHINEIIKWLGSTLGTIVYRLSSLSMYL